MLVLGFLPEFDFTIFFFFNKWKFIVGGEYDNNVKRVKSVKTMLPIGFIIFSLFSESSTVCPMK